MLTPEEEKFVAYWKDNRSKQKNLLRQILPGFVVGIAIGAAIVLLLDSGWYERANMVAASQMNPYTLLISIVLIAVFLGVFYKRHQWELNEQRYQELCAKRIKEGESNAADNVIR